jgi:hypothetical protein
MLNESENRIIYRIKDLRKIALSCGHNERNDLSRVGFRDSRIVTIENAICSLKPIVTINEEHRLENLEPEPEPGEPRLETLEA